MAISSKRTPIGFDTTDVVSGFLPTVTHGVGFRGWPLNSLDWPGIPSNDVINGPPFREPFDSQAPVGGSYPLTITQQTDDSPSTGFQQPFKPAFFTRVGEPNAAYYFTYHYITPPGVEESQSGFEDIWSTDWVCSSNSTLGYRTKINDVGGYRQTKYPVLPPKHRVGTTDLGHPVSNEPDTNARAIFDDTQNLFDTYQDLMIYHRYDGEFFDHADWLMGIKGLTATASNETTVAAAPRLAVGIEQQPHPINLRGDLTVRISVASLYVISTSYSYWGPSGATGRALTTTRRDQRRTALTDFMDGSKIIVVKRDPDGNESGLPTGGGSYPQIPFVEQDQTYMESQGVEFVNESSFVLKDAIEDFFQLA
jgi:hypothetical protein